MSKTNGQAQPFHASEKAAWNRVHMAVVRRGLWSPACSDEIGWVAPLADPTLAGQITCKVCHPLAMKANGGGERG